MSLSDVCCWRFKSSVYDAIKTYIKVVSEESAASVFSIVQQDYVQKIILKMETAGSSETLSLHAVTRQKIGTLITTRLLVFNFLRLINNNSKTTDGVRR
jgi:hypothetical protein